MKNPESKYLAIPLAITAVVVLGCLGPADATPLPSVSLSSSPAARAVAVSGDRTLDPPAPMSVHAGQTADQTLHASDPDGEPLTFAMFQGPPYVTVTTVDPDPENATGLVHLAPTLGDAGTARALVTVQASYFSMSAYVNISVFPLLDQPLDMTVEEGSVADQGLTGTDSDGHPLTFSLASGPSFATVTTTSDTTGNVHLAPGIHDSGWYRATISMSDGSAAHSGTFLIGVSNLNAPPALSQPADMHPIANTTVEQVLVASDPDGDALTFYKIAGPSYMTVGTLSAIPPRGYVRLSNPSPGDTGTVVATVRVTDGTSSDQKSFAIWAAQEDTAPVLNPKALDLTEGTDLETDLVIFDPDGQRLEVNYSAPPRFMSLARRPQPVGSDSLLVHARLLPTYNDAGSYSVRLDFNDGLAFEREFLSITVRDAYPGETSLRIGRSGGSGGPLEYEYSAVDGAYSTSSASPDRVNLLFAATNGSAARWTLMFAAPPGSPLAEGNYSSNPVGGVFSITGSDSTVPGLAGCPQVRMHFQVKRIVRRLDGSIISFWATFEQWCEGQEIHGEVRFQVPGIPITLVAPRWLTTNAIETLVFHATAVDTAHDAIALSVSGLPAGARFVDSGTGQGTFAWTPPQDQRGEHLVRAIASSAGGLADTVFTSIHVGVINHTPRARANGPYTGSVGGSVLFTSEGSGDPDGDSPSYRWTFGDGGTASEPSPSHIYRAIGPYPVSLIVSDGVLESGDQTLATISWPESARAFEVHSAGSGGPQPLQLQAGAARFCVALEVPDSPYSLLDLDRFSFRMQAKGLGNTEEIFADPTAIVLGDTDGNSVPDVTACFSRQDLRNLFERVKGRLSVDVTIDLLVLGGHIVRATLPLEVIGPEQTLRVLMAPNPFRLAGMLSFVTTRVGAARLTLFDTSGRLVRTLLDTTSLPSGYHDIPVDARGGNGTQLSSGIYFYRLETPEGTQKGRMAITK